MRASVLVQTPLSPLQPSSASDSTSSTTYVSSDVRTRSRIEMINNSTSIPAPVDTQLIVHDWTLVPRMVEQEMDLGLVLGRPDAIRRIGRRFGVNEMVLLPEDRLAQAWDV